MLAWYTSVSGALAEVSLSYGLIKEAGDKDAGASGPMCGRDQGLAVWKDQQEQPCCLARADSPVAATLGNPALQTYLKSPNSAANSAARQPCLLSEPTESLLHHAAMQGHAVEIWDLLPNLVYVHP